MNVERHGGAGMEYPYLLPQQPGSLDQMTALGMFRRQRSQLHGAKHKVGDVDSPLRVSPKSRWTTRSRLFVVDCYVLHRPLPAVGTRNMSP